MLDSEHTDSNLCQFWNGVISDQKRDELKNTLNTEGFTLLNAASKFQSQILMDYANQTMELEGSTPELSWLRNPRKRLFTEFLDQSSKTSATLDTTELHTPKCFRSEGSVDSERQEIDIEAEESSDSSYRPSSSHSDSSADSAEQPREWIEWMVGLGSEESVLLEGSEHWIVDGISMSEILMEYRQSCIVKVHAARLEDMAEFLALNHIFLFEEETSLREMLDGELWKAVDNIKGQFISYQLSDSDVLRCHAISECMQAATRTFEDCKLVLRKWQQEKDGDDILTEFFENVLHSSFWWNHGSEKEDTFVHEVMAPVVKPFFTSNKLFQYALDASAHRRKKFDPSLEGKKPDFTVLTSVKKKKEFLLVSEVKPPKHRLQDHLLNDKTKLGNLMKDSLDMMIDDGVEDKDVIVCGLLVQGFQCSLYTMDLRYNAIYRMTLLGQFFLPRNNYDFGVLPNTIQMLMKTKMIVTHTCEICVKSLRIPKSKTKAVSKEKDHVDVGGRKGGESSTPLRKSMARDSYHTPMKVPVSYQVDKENPFIDM